MNGLEVALAAAVSAVVATALVRRWSHAGQRHLLPVVWGGVLILAGILAGLWRLPPESAPTGEPQSIGVALSAEPAAREGNGLAVGLGVEVDSCGERAEASLVVNGSAEYWRGQARQFPDAARFRVSLPGADLRDVRVGMSDNARDVQSPTRAEPGKPPFLRDVRVRELHGVTVASGTVDQWPKHLNSIVVTFRPDWLERRSIGSCYLRLPALTGGLTVLATQLAEERVRTPGPRDAAIRSERTGAVAVYDPRLETTFAGATVVVNNGDMLGEGSRPPPDETFEGHPMWVCETRPPRTGEIDTDGDGRSADIVSGSSTAGAAYSREYARDARGSDCDGIAVIVENSAGTKRDLLLLSVGSIVSLGAATIVGTLFGPGGVVTRDRTASGSGGRRRRWRRRKA